MADLWDSLEEATTVLDEPFHREAICDALREAAATGRSLGARLAEAEQIVRAVDKVGAAAVANGGRIELTQGAVLFTAAANYLVKHRSSSTDSADAAPRRTPSGLCTHDDSSWCTDECRGSTASPTRPADAPPDATVCDCGCWANWSGKSKGQEALIRVRAHTGYQAWADRELLAGLLATIERITDAALAKLGDKP